MEGFNPITDLQQNEDKFNVPAGTSTPEIENIREKLVETRNKTAELVKVIKRHNTLFKKDIDRIKILNKRLYKTIPRIPAMRGVASSEFGSELKDEDKKARLQLDFFRSFRSKSLIPAPVKQPLPILEAVIFLILTRLGLGGKKGGGGNRITKFFSKFFKNKKSKTQIPDGDDLSKIIQDLIKKRKEQGLDVKPLEITLKNLQKSARKKEILKNMKNLKPSQRENRRRKIIKKKGEELLYDMQAKGEIKGDLLGDKSRLSMKGRALLDIIKNKYAEYTQSLTKLFKIQRNVLNRKSMTPYKGNSPAMRQAMEVYDMLFDAVKNAKKNDTMPKNEAMEKAVQALRAFQDGLRANIRDTNNPRKIRQIEEALKFLEGKTDKLLKVIKKESPETFEKILNNIGIKADGTPVSSIETKPFSNDIASLNIDTGITNEVIIITDQLPPIA